MCALEYNGSELKPIAMQYAYKEVLLKQFLLQNHIHRITSGTAMVSSLLMDNNTAPVHLLNLIAYNILVEFVNTTVHLFILALDSL